MKILHLDEKNYPIEVIQDLRSKFTLETEADFDIKNQFDLDEHLSRNQYDVIFVRLGYRIGKAIIQNQKSLSIIVSPTTGLNHIDVEYAKFRCIQIVSLQNEFDFLSHIQSTSEHVWMLLLALSKKLPQRVRDVSNKQWIRLDKSLELNGRVLGIIGYGRLGKLVKGYAHAFGMEVLVNDIREIEIPNTELNTLLSKSDVIILLVNYHFDYENMINKSSFNLMKDGVIFINCSRGELVNEIDLLGALNSGKIGACGLDVLRGDSDWKQISASHPLLKYSKSHLNLIITPHVGGFSDYSIFQTRQFVTNKFLRLITNYESNTDY